MQHFIKKGLFLILRYAPIAIIILLGLWIAIANIIPNTHYAGWDNIIAEFNFSRYAKQTFFGAWIEHQGLGAPAAQGFLAEISRLPILWALLQIFPIELIRYIYILGCHLIGGIGVYYYILKFWIPNTTRKITNEVRKTNLIQYWLAGLGGILYMLHILTLQQFYIAFEMFMAQFAFLPFVLMSIHLLFPTKKDIKKTHTVSALLIFIFIQFLIAPSGHTPTVFYLAVLFTQIYGFFLHLESGIGKSITVAFLIGLMTTLSNAYWIIPNLYYSFSHSHYVSESRNNIIFGPEALWSIKESSNWQNFLKGTHYLFTWKDYSFEKREFSYIFDEWQSHLDTPYIKVLLSLVGTITILGFGINVINSNKQKLRIGFVFTYLLCVIFIWVDLFPTKYFFDILYSSPSFLEAFRNPFTKLSIIYSFVSIVLFIDFFKYLFESLLKRYSNFTPHTILITSVSMIAIIITALPSLNGHFISEKLRITFPEQYHDLFAFLQNSDYSTRVLQLPQNSHAGWEYYDWQFIRPGNGYQGMGFYFFGFDQPFMSRDSDRWVETSDFFYHELKYALDTRNSKHFQEILKKYNIDTIIIDETKVDPHFDLNYQLDHELVSKAGLKKIWHLDFLTVYFFQDLENSKSIISHPSLTYTSGATDRVRIDQIFAKLGNYITPDNTQETQIYFPFSNLMKTEISDVSYTENSVIFKPNTTEISSDSYTLHLPSIFQNEYLTAAAIQKNQSIISVNFPQYYLNTQYDQYSLPSLEPIVMDLNTLFTELIPNLREELSNLINQNLIDNRTDYSNISQYLDIVNRYIFSDQKQKESIVNDLKQSENIVLFFEDLGIVLDLKNTVTPTLSLDIEKPIVISVGFSEKDFDIRDDGTVDTTQLTLIPILLFNPDWSKFTNDYQLKVNIKNHHNLSLEATFVPHQLQLDQNPSINCSNPIQGNINTIKTNGGDSFIYSADNFAVNCNGYRFEYISPAGEYVLRSIGSNIQGRGTKLFLNYLYPRTMPEDFLFREAFFDHTLTIHPVSNDPQALFYLNWETRSFGKRSENIIDMIQVWPFSLTYFAGMQLIPDAHSLNADTYSVNASKTIIDHPDNNITFSIIDMIELFPAVTYIEGICPIKKCNISNNQSYDSLWIAISLQDYNISLLPKYRLNNWTQTWEIPQGNHTLIILYVPEIAQLALLLVLGICIVTLIFLYCKLHVRKKS